MSWMYWHIIPVGLLPSLHYRVSQSGRPIQTVPEATWTMGLDCPLFIVCFQAHREEVHLALVCLEVYFCTFSYLFLRCFSFADLPWYQRKVAAIIFASPPNSTYEEVRAPLSVSPTCRLFECNCCCIVSFRLWNSSWKLKKVKLQTCKATKTVTKRIKKTFN